MSAHSLIFRIAASLGIATLLAGCATETSPIPQSQGHITAKPEPVASSAIPAPVQVATQLPPPKAQAKPLTYNVVVTEVPAKELLFSLARDTKLNIDVHPNIQGVVTLNAINETLPAILDRIAQQVNIRYKLDGNTLIITPDSPYLKTYHVDYVNLSRKTTSSIGVSAQVATTGAGATTGSSGNSTGGASNSSSTTVTSTSNNEFWETLAANVRDIVKSTRVISLSSEEKNARVEAIRSAREERLQQANAVARAGQAAPQLFNAAFGQGAQGPTEEKKDDVIVNPVSGTVIVLATEAQHKLVQQYLAGVSDSANRQVLIEATIVEVTLKDQFRAGIDWTRLATLASTSTGFKFTPAANLVNAVTGFATLTYQNKSDNFKAEIDLLESFGDTRVLSSPKLMVLNNQTSMLKVVDNLVYFSIEVQPATTSSSGTVISPATYTTTARTVPVGVIMAVTPQVSEGGKVTLVVRPTISRQNGSAKDPNPALTIENNVPIIQVREMESVLQIASGETIVLGGLMQDDIAKNRDGLPGLTGNAATNIAAGSRERKVTQTELVIFLRPTVVNHPSLSSDELSFFKRYLPQAQPTTQP